MWFSRNKSLLLMATCAAIWALLGASSGVYAQLMKQLRIPHVAEFTALPVALTVLFAILSTFLYQRFRLAGGMLIAIMLTVFIGLIALPIQSSLKVELSAGMLILSVWTAFLIYYTVQAILNREEYDLRDPLAAQIPSPILRQLRAQEKQLSLQGKSFEGTSVYIEMDCLHDQLARSEPEMIMPLIAEANELIVSLVKAHMGIAEIAPGGAVAAFWQHSDNVPEQTISACNAVLKIRRVLRDVEEKLIALPGINTAGWLIGMHSGKLVVGNVGPGKWQRISAGGAVAQASQQIARLNTLYGSRILLSERCFELISEHIWARKFSRIRLPREDAPLYLHQLLGLQNEALGASRIELLDHFQEGLELYMDRKWELAANRFRQALQIDGDDEPSRIYLLRCQEFLLKPPPRDWQGVYAVPSSATSRTL